MKYYPIVKKWKIIKSAIEQEKVQTVLVRDFNKFTFGRWGYTFKRGEIPAAYESCDWQFSKKGRHPEYWNYVKHSACHWLVNFNLEIAKIVEPNKEWRIVTSQKHSTVWDGEETLFDFNFSAFGIDPDEAFELANERQLKAGRKMAVYFTKRVI